MPWIARAQTVSFGNERAAVPQHQAPVAYGRRHSGQRWWWDLGSACAPVRLRGLLTLMPKYRLETRGRRRPVYWYRR